MARYIEQGKSIFIPFYNGVSITDSQLHLRMYKTEEMFKRYFPRLTKYDVLCEYAPVVRCKGCTHGVIDACTNRLVCARFGEIRPNGHVWGGSAVLPDHFCSYGERRASEIQTSQSL